MDLSANNMNCGMCGMACAAGQACAAGICGCPTGRSACGGACVNVQTDMRHCGACDKPCGTGAACVLGQCTCAPV